MKKPDMEILIRGKYILWHIGFLVMAVVIMWIMGNPMSFLADPSLLCTWDASWYDSIRLNGYQFDPSRPSNTAFFPLFPYLWKFSGLGVVGISVLNFVLMISGLLILGKAYQIETAPAMLYLSFPTMFFHFVPYSEALFFLTSSFFLVGFKRNNTPLVLLGLFLSSLVRPTAIYYVPALIGLFIFGFNKQSWRKPCLATLAALSVVVLALVGVALFQWKETGEFLAYPYMQTHFWGHEFILPQWPFSDTFPQNLWYNLFAVFLAFLSAVVLVSLLYLKFAKKQDHPLMHDSGILFSLLCLAGALCFILFFEVHPARHCGTNIRSAGRHLCCVPFTLLLVDFAWKHSNRLKHGHFLIVPALIGVMLLAGGVTLTSTVPGCDPGTVFLAGGISTHHPSGMQLFYFGLIAAWMYIFTRALYYRDVALAGGLYVFQLISQVFELCRYSAKLWVG